MSWTVPSGCYYAYLDTNWIYKGAGTTIADSYAPEYVERCVLVDFANGYIYTNISKASTGNSPIITMNANDSFTLSDDMTAYAPSATYLIASEWALSDKGLTLAGEPFAFGDGTGMLSKGALLSSGTSKSYSAYGAFRYRRDITVARFPQGVDYIQYMYSGCTGITSSDPLPNVTIIIGTFENCKALLTAPSIPSTCLNMYSCFYGCSSLETAPSIPSTCTSIYYTFAGCSSLTTAPAIPASVTNVGHCFHDCSSLRGNVVVHNASMTTYASVFSGTQNDIYIVNGAGTSEVATTWRTIANGYSNVHYEADDNQTPSLSFTATRVSGMASETPSENGEYAFINATAIVYETYLPDGWSCAYDAGEEDITKDSTTQSPYWTRTNIGNTWTLKCWLSLGDTTKHTFTLQVADEITDENDNVKASQLSAIITQIIPKAYKLVDYYHDPTTDTEGMAVGKFATEANLFDVDMPALFRDTLSLKDGNAVIRLLFDYVYPVGSYYETSKSQAEFDPNVVWGGTWELELAGQVHVSSGTGYAVSGATSNTSDGGASTVTLDTTKIPSHTHGSKSLLGYMSPLQWKGSSASGICSVRSSMFNLRNPNAGTTNQIGTVDVTINATHEHTSVGGGQAHENMPPYIVVNRWHRTA